MGSEHDQVNERTPGEQAARGDAPAADDVFQVLAEFERGLSGLTRLFEQRQQLQAALQERLGAVERRESRSRERAEAVERAEKEWSAKAEEAERARQSLDAERQRLAEIAREVETEAQALAERRVELDRLSTQADEQRQLAERDAEQQRAQVAVLRAEAARLQAELGKREASLDARRTEWERRSAEHAASLESRQAEVTEASRRVAERDAALAAAASGLERDRADLDAGKSRLAEQAEEHRRQSARASELAERLAERTGACQAHERRIEDLTNRLDEAESRRGEAQGEAERRGALAASFEARCQRAEKTLQDFQSQMAGDAAAAAEPLARLSRELEEASAERDELRRRVVDAMGRLKSFEAQRQGDQEALRVAMEAKERELGDARARMGSLADQLAEAQRALREQPRSAGEVGQPPPAGDGPGSLSPDAARRLESRRRRLHQYRRIAEAHAQKVRKAGEALQRRYELCEQVLGQRADLAAAKQALGAAHAVIERRRAGSRAVGLVCFLVLTLATLGALSWALAWSFFPGTYIASVTLRAENPSRELNAAELDDWSKYHAAQLSDPQFIAVAAERMQARGWPPSPRPGPSPSG